MTVEAHHEECVENPSEHANLQNEMQNEAILVPIAVPLSAQDVLPEQGFAEVTHVEEDNPREEAEELVPLVYPSLSMNGEMIQDVDVLDNSDSIDIAHRLLSPLRLTDNPPQQ